jgi:hypothetical protein
VTDATRAFRKKPRRISAGTLLLIAGLLLAAPAFGNPFIGAGTTVELPSVGSLTIRPIEIHFDLTGPDYPPESFDNAYYAPAGRDGEEVVVRPAVTSGSSARWQVNVEFAGFSDAATQATLDADRLQYSLNASDWLPFGKGEIALVMGPDASTKMLESYDLRLRLQVFGDEKPGLYSGMFRFTLVSRP